MRGIIRHDRPHPPTHCGRRSACGRVAGRQRHRRNGLLILGAFPSNPRQPLQGAQHPWRDRLKPERSASGDQPLDNIECYVGPKILPHDPCILDHRGLAGQRRARNEMENPVRDRRGPENRRAPSSAHTKPLVHPLEVDSMSACIPAVRMETVMTIIRNASYRAKPAARTKRERRRQARVLSSSQFFWRTTAERILTAPRAAVMPLIQAH
jgi:hypothetical protein